MASSLLLLFKHIVSLSAPHHFPAASLQRMSLLKMAALEQLEALSKKLGRLKGVDKLYTEALKAKMNVTKKQVQDFVAGIGQKQILTQSQPSLGKSATSTIENKGSRWQVDLLQFRFSGQDDEETDDEADESKKRYCLLLINVFDRKLHGVALTDKSEETVTAATRKYLKKLGEDMKGGL